MAKASPTFKKRQRENKLREKAQRKRESRQQRAMEKKLSKGADTGPTVSRELEHGSYYDQDGELNA